jgi:yecA family protein
MPDLSRTRSELKAYFSRSSHPGGTLSYHGLHGFLFALTAGPEGVAPGEWIEAVFGGHAPAFANGDERRRIFDALAGLHAEIAAEVSVRKFRLPDDCAFRDDVLTNFDDDVSGGTSGAAA